MLNCERHLTIKLYLVIFRFKFYFIDVRISETMYFKVNFYFGQSRCGKTHTIKGVQTDFELQGIINLLQL